MAISKGNMERNCFKAERALIFLIKGYNILVSPFLGYNCRFVPNCSVYAQTAIEKHGVFYGLWLVAKRLLKCHPLHKGGYDPVPEEKKTKNREKL